MQRTFRKLAEKPGTWCTALGLSHLGTAVRTGPEVLHQAEAITALHVHAPAARVSADQQVRQAQEAI